MFDSHGESRQSQTIETQTTESNMFRYVTIRLNEPESVKAAEKRKAMLESEGWTLIHTSTGENDALLSYSDNPKLVDAVSESA